MSSETVETMTKNPQTRAKPATHRRAPAAAAFARPYTTVDVVIFTVLSDALNVLLVQRPADTSEPFPGQWALPGGFVNVELDRDLVSCARRKLHEKTGVDSPYLEQLGSWGSATRDPRGWSATHAYFALIPAPEVQLAKGANAADVAWFKVDQLLPRARLAFDHAQILQAAVERLRSKVEYTSLPAYLLPEPFTLPQLQRMYEVVLGRAVDKSGFRTRMLAADFLEPVGVIESDSNRPPLGYRLKDRSNPIVFPRTFSPRGGAQ
jgi:8-oxo-dGTP diphosphatase